MSEYTGRWRFQPEDEKQIPLALKYEGKDLWDDIKAEIGVGATGAAIAVALREGHLIGKATSYSRNSNYYSSSRRRHPLMTLGKVRRDMQILEEAGWIQHYRQPPGAFGWQSAAEATPVLVSFASEVLLRHPKPRLLRSRDVLILRDDEGALINLKLTRELDRMARKVDDISEAICSLDVVDPQGVNLAAPVARIFNIDPKLGRGGRFYGMGTCWQNIKSEARKAITINGEPVVELDFRTLHPAVLYSEVGAPMPVDCYDVGDGWSRPLIKVAMLTLINATREPSARHSIAHSQQLLDHCDAIGAPVAPGSQEALRLASKLIGIIKTGHKAIAHAFHSDAGARLMRKDSDMAEAVMTLLMLKKGIPVLPVHDSFLVPASKRDELEAAMMQAAYEIGRLSQIKVETK